MKKVNFTYFSHLLFSVSRAKVSVDKVLEVEKFHSFFRQNFFLVMSFSSTGLVAKKKFEIELNLF